VVVLSSDPSAAAAVRARLAAQAEAVLVVDRYDSIDEVLGRADADAALFVLDPRIGPPAFEALGEALARTRGAGPAPVWVLPVAPGDAGISGPRGTADAFTALAESVEDGVLVLDGGDTVRHANAAAERLLAAPAGGLLGRRDLVQRLDLGRADGTPLPPAEHPIHLARWRGWRFVEAEVSLRRLDGEAARLRLRAQSLPAPPGVAARDLVVVLSRGHGGAGAGAHPVPRLEAAARVAGGMAHDFNNLLCAIQFHLEMLGGAVARDTEAHAHVREALETTERAAGLTRRLLAFSRHQALQLAHVDLPAFLGSMRPLLDHMLGADIELRLRVDPSLGRVRTDPGQLEQLFMNLATNARDAMPAGGQLEISVADAVLDEAFVAAHPGARPGRHVHIAFADTGSGMDEVTLRRAVEPYFTTKARGGGSGLGLSTVYGFVKQAGGWLGLTSAPGAGTRVDVYLPHP
jgi:signal transduction histidine kinase